MALCAGNVKAFCGRCITTAVTLSCFPGLSKGQQGVGGPVFAEEQGERSRSSAQLPLREAPLFRPGGRPGPGSAARPPADLPRALGGQRGAARAAWPRRGKRSRARGHPNARSAGLAPRGACPPRRLAPAPRGRGAGDPRTSEQKEEPPRFPKDAEFLRSPSWCLHQVGTPESSQRGGRRPPGASTWPGFSPHRAP